METDLPDVIGRNGGRSEESEKKGILVKTLILFRSLLYVDPLRYGQVELAIKGEHSNMFLSSSHAGSGLRREV